MGRFRLGVCVAQLVTFALVYGVGTAKAGDPTTVDCLTANDHAITLQGQHKLGAARSALLVCASATCPGDVRAECSRRVADVNALMPTVVFEAKDQAGNDMSAVSVAMDGRPLTDKLEGTALSIDPGDHDFVFNAAGYPAVQRHFVIHEAEKGRRELVVFGAANAAPANVAPANVAPANVAPSSAPGPDRAAPQKPGSTRRVVGYVVGGVGVVALGVALAEQLTAKSRDDKSHTAADAPDPAVQATVHPLHVQAERAQTYAIISGAIGVAAVGAGLFLILSGSSHAGDDKASVGTLHVVPVVGSKGGGLFLERAF